MVKQREMTSRMAWFFIAFGSLVMLSGLYRDWSAWPDLRTVLGASMALFGAGEIVVGVYALGRARGRRDVRVG